MLHSIPSWENTVLRLYKNNNSSKNFLLRVNANIAGIYIYMYGLAEIAPSGHSRSLRLPRDRAPMGSSSHGLELPRDQVKYYWEWRGKWEIDCFKIFGMEEVLKKCNFVIFKRNKKSDIDCPYIFGRWEKWEIIC